MDTTMPAHQRSWDYVVVGSGAGGGTLAARLVEGGQRVFLIEAGPDPADADAAAVDARLPDDYEVPGFHAHASENPAISWNFHVRHYADTQRQARDPKFVAERDGVLYPRAAALGGCTAHNAMIFMPPHDSDWDHIAGLTGDRSWRASAMRRHLKRLEDCRHRPVWRALRHLGLDPTGHGWNGWLRTERSVPLQALGDPGMVALAARTAATLLAGWRHPIDGLRHALWGAGDPNARGPKLWRGSFEGLCYTPLSTAGHRRTGTRERLLQVAQRHPGRLHVETDALATRVLFDAEGAACGVEYLKGRHLYRAHALPARTPGERRTVQAGREVVLCGGAFNTPQLLMLSGIGPAEELRRHGIAVRHDLAGVGRNLQDRYEIALTHRMGQPWELLDGARFRRGDRPWQRWRERRSSLYDGSGAALAVVRRSSRRAPEPDLFCMALPTLFEGYAPGYSRAIEAHADRLTWAVLKAHTRNRAGRVTLRSADPLEPPHIDFRYFEEGDDQAGEDLRAMVEAIRFVRRLTEPLRASGVIAEETSPGLAVDSDEALARHVRDTAWGHHASCSCPIGPVADGGVLASDFRVHGLRRLRVVDASVFPRIPGFFVAAAVYLVGEKAAETLLQQGDPPRPPGGGPATGTHPRSTT
ncbi:GMC family oxidoreductase [Leptothrix discophora]|uniref:GMC family oxidoreductase n=1 Tax=Leptothrix discophora TaxID=89 RepID=A0ABT9G4P7_LEPDI|nr:GMC family oxidoreductase [Leptothrix discophora]MDP4301437.1 GMC family oxidoreductase [Leptothrix discophora]